MKCPYCKEFRGNSKVRGYTVKEQLHRHIEVKHQIKEVKTMTQQEIDKRLEELRAENPEAVIVPPGYVEAIDGKKYYNEMFIIAK